MNFNNELTLLSEEEIFGVDSGRQLDVLQKYGTKSGITDLAVLTGAHTYSFENISTFGPIMPDEYGIKARTGWCYTRSSTDDGQVFIVVESGDREYKHQYKYHYNRTGTIRPVLKSPEIFHQISQNRVSGYNGTEEVEYGEYPQYAPNEKIQKELFERLKVGILKKTGYSYTFDNNNPLDSFTHFQPKIYDEYKYIGKKYICVKAKSSFTKSKFRLSNGEYYFNGNDVWIEVSPVVWLIDDRTETLLSKVGLLSGIRFHAEDKEYNGDFSKTEVKEYLDKYMLRELTQTATFTRIEDMTSEEKKEYEGEQKKMELRRNPYEFKFNDVSEEDIIKGSIESGIPVFLHGQSL